MDFIVSWSPISPPGVPAGRYGCTLNTLGNNLYAFGGYSSRYLSEFLELTNLNANPHWRLRHKLRPYPSARRGHVSASYNGTLVLFGGDLGTRCTNDLWMFDGKEWRSLNLVKDPPMGAASANGSMNLSMLSYNAAGGGQYGSFSAMPPPRYGHSGCVYNDFFVVFGGADRYGKTILYGDAWALNLQSLRWTRLPDGPAARYGHSLICLGTTIILFGGLSASGRLNDVWRLDGLSTDSPQWTLLFSDTDKGLLQLNTSICSLSSGHAIAPRTEASCVPLNARSFLVVGGSTIDGPANDTWVVTLGQDNRISFVQLANNSLHGGLAPHPSSRHACGFTVHNAGFVGEGDAASICGAAGMTLTSSYSSILPGASSNIIYRCNFIDCYQFAGTSSVAALNDVWHCRILLLASTDSTSRAQALSSHRSVVKPVQQLPSRPERDSCPTSIAAASQAKQESVQKQRRDVPVRMYSDSLLNPVEDAEAPRGKQDTLERAARPAQPALVQAPIIVEPIAESLIRTPAAPQPDRQGVLPSKPSDEEASRGASKDTRGEKVSLVSEDMARDILEQDQTVASLAEALVAFKTGVVTTICELDGRLTRIEGTAADALEDLNDVSEKVDELDRILVERSQSLEQVAIVTEMQLRINSLTEENRLMKERVSRMEGLLMASEAQHDSGRAAHIIIDGADRLHAASMVGDASLDKCNIVIDVNSPTRQVIEHMLSLDDDLTRAESTITNRSHSIRRKLLSDIQVDIADASVAQTASRALDSAGTEVVDDFTGIRDDSLSAPEADQYNYDAEMDFDEDAETDPLPSIGAAGGTGAVRMRTQSDIARDVDNIDAILNTVIDIAYE